MKSRTPLKLVLGSVAKFACYIEFVDLNLIQFTRMQPDMHTFFMYCSIGV